MIVVQLGVLYPKFFVRQTFWDIKLQVVRQSFWDGGSMGYCRKVILNSIGCTYVPIDLFSTAIMHIATHNVLKGIPTWSCMAFCKFNSSWSEGGFCTRVRDWRNSKIKWSHRSKEKLGPQLVYTRIWVQGMEKLKWRQCGITFPPNQWPTLKENSLKLEKRIFIGAWIQSQVRK